MLSNENRLLAYCTHPDQSDQTRQEITKLLSQELDWHDIRTAASWYSIKPIMFKLLTEHTESVPAQVMDDLKSAYDAILVRNTYIYGLLTRIMVVFAQHGIRCIVLKGAALAEPVYHDVGLRPMQDIDLMFHKADIEQVMSLLADIGFHHEGGRTPQYFLDHHHHITFTHTNTDIPIELHWHIAHDTHPGRLKSMQPDFIDGWFDRAQTIRLSGSYVQVLCAEDQIIHLSLHFLKHRFPRFCDGLFSATALSQLADITRVIEYHKAKIDWPHLFAIADRHGINELVATTVYLSAMVSHGQGSSEADNLKSLTSAAVNEQMAGLMYKHIFMRQDLEYYLPRGFFTRDSWKDGHKVLRNIFRLLIPYKESLSKRYPSIQPSRKLYFYYLVNPVNYISMLKRVITMVPNLREEKVMWSWIRGHA